MNERDQNLWDMTFASTFGALIAGTIIARLSDGDSEIEVSVEIADEFAKIARQTATNAIAMARKE